MAQNFINGILIPEDGEPRRVALETDGRGLMGDALSRLVGGCFDTLPIVIPGVDLWVNDDGTSEFGPNRAIYATRAMEERGCLSQIDYRHVPAEVVDLVAEDEERERLAERSGLADPHGDMPDKEYLEAAVIIHDNGHAHGECYATDRHTGMVRFGRFELTDMELNQLGRELPFLADREDPRKGQERLGRFFGGSPYVRHSERYVGGGRHEANPDIRAGIADYLDAALAEYRESGYSAYEGGMSMTGYQTRDLSDIKAFISYIASSPDCPATTTLRSWAEYEDLSDHAGFLTDLLDEARGRLDGFGLSGPECGAGMDADAMGVQGPAR